MPPRKSLDELSRSGLRSRKRITLKKLQFTEDSLRSAEVDDRTCDHKNKTIRRINAQRTQINAEIAEILEKLNKR